MDPATTGAATPYRPNSLLEEMRTPGQSSLHQFQHPHYSLLSSLRRSGNPPCRLRIPTTEHWGSARASCCDANGYLTVSLRLLTRTGPRSPTWLDYCGDWITALDWAVRTLGFDRPNAVLFVDFVEDLRRVFDPPVDSDHLAKHLLSRRRGQASVGEHSVVRPNPAPRIWTAFRPSPYPAAASEPQRTLVPVPAASAPQPAPVPAASAPQPAPVPAASAPQPAPVPAASAPQPAPVPAASAPQPAPVPAVSAPQPAPVPAASALQPAPVPAASAPQRPPVPAAAVSVPQRPPVPAAAVSEPQRPPVPAAAVSEPQRPPVPAAGVSEPQRPPVPLMSGSWSVWSECTLVIGTVNFSVTVTPEAPCEYTKRPLIF
ncbi:uncharacterized protein LOC142969672 [Anarhichas minor]|uniref:uncharacterized protein LOC142969672 n=1 Tax=Anarhichas minor TaxID=65739 RepID=UPI003F736B79